MFFDEKKPSVEIILKDTQGDIVMAASIFENDHEVPNLESI